MQKKDSHQKMAILIKGNLPNDNLAEKGCWEKTLHKSAQLTSEMGIEPI